MSRINRFATVIMLIMSMCFLVPIVLVPVVAAFAVETPSVSRQQHPTIIEVPRMTVDEFTTYWRNLHQERPPPKNGHDVRNYDHPLTTPILVTGVLSSGQCAEIGSLFMETAQSDTPIFVELQRRRTVKEGLWSSKSRRRSLMKPVRSSELRSYNVSLAQAIDTILTQSHHHDAFWCFQEGLLEDHSAFQPIHQVLKSISQSLLQCHTHVEDERIPDNESTNYSGFTNWFDYFPNWAQSTDCVILSGIGSTSTLHRDPFEWTGTSVCLEGTKVWRFIEPTPNVHTIDAMMKSYRLPSVAWNGTATVSAGWQSDFSLYRNIKPTDKGQRDEAWSIAPTTSDDKYRQVFKMAQSLDVLQPDEALMSNWTTTTTTNIWTTVQQEGDFVIIPAHYWHQTYTIIEPTVTISSQHCSDFDLARVLNHMVTTTNRTNLFHVEDLVVELWNENHPNETMQQFFQQLHETFM